MILPNFAPYFFNVCNTLNCKLVASPHWLLTSSKILSGEANYEQAHQ